MYELNDPLNWMLPLEDIEEDDDEPFSRVTQSLGN